MNDDLIGRHASQEPRNISGEARATERLEQLAGGLAILVGLESIGIVVVFCLHSFYAYSLASTPLMITAGTALCSLAITAVTLVLTVYALSRRFGD